MNDGIDSFLEEILYKLANPPGAKFIKPLLPESPRKQECLFTAASAVTLFSLSIMAHTAIFKNTTPPECWKNPNLDISLEDRIQLSTLQESNYDKNFSSGVFLPFLPSTSQLPKDGYHGNSQADLNCIETTIHRFEKDADTAGALGRSAGIMCSAGLFLTAALYEKMEKNRS